MIFNTLRIFTVVAIITALIFYFGFCFFAGSQIVGANTSLIGTIPSVIGLDSENIVITTNDNIKLKGWLFKSSGNKLVIMVADFKQDRINNDYFGSRIAKELIDLGYNIILYDNRATGESEGKFITLGVKESQDLLSVVDFARSKGYEDKNIAILGDSMGAISLLQDSDKLENIGAMIADSPAKDVNGVIENLLQNSNHIHPMFIPGIHLVLKYYYGIDISSLKPANHIAKVPNRVFLYLHGEKDTIIFPTESKELLAISNPNSKLVIFENAEHVQTYKTNPELYRKTVFTFLEQNLGK